MIWRRTILGGAASTFDRAVVRALEFRNVAKHARAIRTKHDERLSRLNAIEGLYGDPALISDPSLFFRAPETIEPRWRVRGNMPGKVTVVDASWPSLYEPYLSVMRDKYLKHEDNKRAFARLYLGKVPRPAIVLIHGFMAGQWPLEERLWPIEWLVRNGLDVASIVLPFHVMRGGSRRFPAMPLFPSADPRFTNEGFGQAIYDIRTLMRLLRSRGAPLVGAMGMSLGGYTTALLATVERDLAFAGKIIPLSSIADWIRDQGRMGRGEQTSEQHAALEAANRVISPFSRPSLVPSNRVFVSAARADRITGGTHAERLATHFETSVNWFPGGHLLQFGRGQAFRDFGKLLRAEGIMPTKEKTGEGKGRRSFAPTAG